MAKKGFLEQQGIVRQTIRVDLLFFAIPALLVFFVGLLLSALAWLEGLLARHPQSLFARSVQNIVGLVLIVLGFTIMLVAYFKLWRYYSATLVIREDHQLITHGIYRFVRHPIYLGVIIVALGIPVCTSSLSGFLVILVLIPIFLIRIRLEEKLLLEEFGDAYQRYRGKTRKLIPFIY